MAEGMDGVDNVENGFLNDIVYDTDIIWKPIGLTNVEYQQGDFIGYILAWFSLLPILLGVGFVTLILFRRDLHTIAFFTGIIIDEAINFILKRILKEPRPIRNRASINEYGMPSSHSQYMWFFSSYLLLFIFIRVHNGELLTDKLWKYFTSTGSILTAATVSFSRVYLGYHTVHQVICGGIIGVTLGPLWFLVVHCILTPCFPVLASSVIGECFMLRDSTLIPNVLWFEYCNHRTEMKNRLRKTSSRKLS